MMLIRFGLLTGDAENQNGGHVLAHPHVHEHVSDEGEFSNARHIVVAQVSS